MKGTTFQKRLAIQLGARPWTDAELDEAARGFTLAEYEAGRRETIKLDRAPVAECENAAGALLQAV